MLCLTLLELADAKELKSFLPVYEYIVLGNWEKLGYFC